MIDRKTQLTRKYRGAASFSRMNRPSSSDALIQTDYVLVQSHPAAHFSSNNPPYHYPLYPKYLRVFLSSSPYSRTFVSNRVQRTSSISGRRWPFLGTPTPVHMHSLAGSKYEGPAVRCWTILSGRQGNSTRQPLSKE